MKLRLSEEQLRKQVQYFGYYQLAGGVLAVCLIIVALAKVESLSGLLFLMYSGFFSLAGFTSYCGYLCLKQPVKGLQLSRLSLLTQLLGFAIGGISFKFAAGPSIALGIDLTKELLFKVDASIAEFSFKINSAPDIVLSVNLVALLLFIRTTLWLNEWHTRYSSMSLSTPPVSRAD